MTAAAAVLLLIGAGCSSPGKQVALTAGQANDQSAITAPDADSIRMNAEQFEADQKAPPNKTDSAGNAQAPEPPPAPATPAKTPDEPKKTMTPRTFPGLLPSAEIHGKQIRLETTKGTIVFELYDGDAPLTVSNFVALTKSGFYDGLTFHRVVPGFVIQGGDPLGNGTGGPGYKFQDEPVHRDYDQGIVAMANSGPNTNGSQFFIMLEKNPLPKQYTIFGKVTSGMDAVHKIIVGDKMTKVTVEEKK